MTDNMEPSVVPHHCEHNSLGLNVPRGFHIINLAIRPEKLLQDKQSSAERHPSFLPEIVGQKMWNASQMARFEPKYFV
jgi:hypothetical protein